MRVGRLRWLCSARSKHSRIPEVAARTSQRIGERVFSKLLPGILLARVSVVVSSIDKEKNRRRFNWLGKMQRLLIERVTGRSQEPGASSQEPVEKSRFVLVRSASSGTHFNAPPGAAPRQRIRYRFWISDGLRKPKKVRRRKPEKMSGRKR